MAEASAEQKAGALANSGWVFYEQGKYDKSEEASRQALELDSSQHICRANLGLAILCQSRATEAIGEYSKVCESVDDSQELRKNALTDLEECHRLHPDIDGVTDAIKMVTKRIEELEANRAD